MRKNLHVPIPDELNEELRAEAERSGQPATKIAREGIRLLLETRRRKAIHEQIQAYAQSMAGSADDHDEDLESASIDHLVESDD